MTVECRLTTQAQRRRPRNGPIETETRCRRSLERMVRHHVELETKYEIPSHRNRNGGARRRHRTTRQHACVAALELAHARNLRAENNLVAASHRPLGAVWSAFQIVK